MIRDGNGTRSSETLLRYRGAAMAEFWRALRTLKALQAEQARAPEISAGTQSAAERTAPALPARIAPRPMPDRLASRRNPNEPRPQAQPDEPERAAARHLAYLPSEPGASGRTLHEPAAPWLPNEPETGRAACAGLRDANEPKPSSSNRAIDRRSEARRSRRASFRVDLPDQFVDVEQAQGMTAALLYGVKERGSSTSGSG
jgi:hypothetical protein